MSSGFSYLLPVMLGLGVLVMIALVFVLHRYVKPHDRGTVDEGSSVSSDLNGNPYQPPFTLELDDHSLVAGPRHSNGYAALPAVCIVAALAVGGGSRLCRQIADIGGIHLEAFAALLILSGLALFLVYLNYRVQGKRTHLFFQVENFSLWLAFAFGWTVVNRGLWDDFIFFNAIAMGCSAVTGSGLLVVLGRLRRNSSAS